ncbi:hypothetical protein SAMD00079811_81760 (plasmid) [Scytonema sp. HK-05]|uniref:hypothetical protein n=1 Tax=Scytonema sp. HK-05 TaxID=1137095 RepID=UPI000936456E|nr:hypothetical protein [Scytonema sp. HK-05]OKH58153.1 hypothetical protein NIES2130_15795 [Scytonema sp. HK-05]BAY50547.1 hypothetical protein SAMD00079811_81760 [Scytonema sp. HK-05]
MKQYIEVIAISSMLATDTFLAPPLTSYALVASFLTIHNGYAVWVVGSSFKLLNFFDDCLLFSLPY